MPRTTTPFDRNVEQWVEYSKSQKGRLRHELIWCNLKPHLRSRTGKLRVLDAGCGLGEMTSFLLGKASSLVLLDFSEKMLKKAKQRLTEEHPDLNADTIIFMQGRVEELDDCLTEGLFDLIICHTLLEYVRNPRRVLASLVERLSPEGLFSLVAVNSFSEAFKLAILKKDLVAARQALRKRDFHASLFDHTPKRTFSLENLEELADGLGLRVLGRYGIRLFADYLPDKVTRDPKNYHLLFDLEKEASQLLPYLHVGRYLHVVCQKGRD